MTNRERSLARCSLQRLSREDTVWHNNQPTHAADRALERFDRAWRGDDFPALSQESGVDADLGLANRPARVHQRELVASCDRVCVWGIGEYSTDSAWQLFNGALGSRAEYLEKVVRVCQLDGAIRFDLYTRLGDGAKVLRRLQAKARYYGWHCREHRVPGRGRPAIEVRRNRKADRTPVSSLTVCSWNINGLRQKRTDVEYFLLMTKPNVLGLQETLRPSHGWRLNFPGFHCIERCATDSSKGERGVALVVSRQFSVTEVGEVDPCWVFARVVGGGLEHPIIVGNVYLPCQRGEAGVRRTKIRQLKGVLRELLGQNEGTPIVLMGDFNCGREALEKLVTGWGLGLALLDVEGSPATWHQPSRGQSAIDHIVVSASLLRKCAPAHVQRRWDLSDHWPLFGKIFAVSKVSEAATPKSTAARRLIDREALRHQAYDFASSNYWEVLAEEFESEEQQADLDAVAEKFVKGCWRTGEAYGVVKEVHPFRGQHARGLRNRTKALIERRRRLYGRYLAARDAEAKAELRAQHKAAAKEAAEETRKERLASWHAHLKHASEMFEERSYKKLWQWMQSFTGRGKNSVAGVVQPVVDPESGKLVTEPHKIGEVWARHYARLAADETGHSRESQHWKQFQVPHLSALENLNQVIEWPEMVEILKRMVDSAPGRDGIPAALLKTAYAESPRRREGLSAAEGAMADEEGPRPTLFGNCLMVMCNLLFENAHVPECWEAASVVSIPKKGGDATSVDSQRGISLIAVTLKLLCTIVISRINLALEGSNRLCQEQAGFRSREECLGQSVALYEILHRRKVAGKATYMCFIDFRKAYDTVPHEALFYKLKRIGVRGAALAFIKALYAKSKISVRGAFGESPLVDLLRGLRQGCPMSPILFDVFINDILSGTARWGVRVPGLAGIRIPGLLFADDLILLAESKEDLHSLMGAVEAWANKWEMSFGAAKCGVMVVGGPDLEAREEMWTLQGQEVKVVEEYTYLGNVFRRDLSVAAMAAERAKRGAKALAAVQPFLRSQSIPLQFRLMVLKAIVMPSFTYGAEIWGMNETLCMPAQRTLNQGLRLLFGARIRSSMIPLATAQEEAGLMSVSGLAAGLRARAYIKFPTLRTWVSPLVTRPMVHRRATWVSGTSRWLKRFGPSRVEVEEKVEQLTGKAAERPERVWFENTREAVWTRKLNADRTRAYAFYRAGKLRESREWVKSTALNPELGRGFNLLARARIGALLTARRLAQARLLAPEWKDRCPACGQSTPETVAHILVVCPRWVSARRTHLQPLIDVCLVGMGNPGQVDPDDLCVLLLGGELGGFAVSRWARLKGSSKTASNASHDGRVNGSPMPVAGCARVAAYLQGIWGLRERLMRPLSRASLEVPPRADAPQE